MIAILFELCFDGLRFFRVQAPTSYNEKTMFKEKIAVALSEQQVDVGASRFSDVIMDKIHYSAAFESFVSIV